LSTLQLATASPRAERDTRHLGLLLSRKAHRRPARGARGRGQGPGAPAPGELFSETNDNSVAIHLTYGTARILLAGEAEARITWRAASARGPKRSSTFRNYTQSEPRFRARLIEGGALVLFHREEFERLDKALGVGTTFASANADYDNGIADFSSSSSARRRTRIETGELSRGWRLRGGEEAWGQCPGK
jgi:hypothetical protein